MEFVHFYCIVCVRGLNCIFNISDVNSYKIHFEGDLNWDITQMKETGAAAVR